MVEDFGADAHSGRLEARYANHFRVGHNAIEMVLEFAQFYAGDRTAATHTKIVTSPAYAKALLGLLQNVVEEYERAHGPIAMEQLDQE
jgi:hypothetical protein